jgi:hypothetical protein
MKTIKRLTAIGLSALALCLGAATAQAWHVSGRVLCDANGNLQIDDADTPLQGVMAIVENVSGTFSAASSTGPDGFFLIVVPEGADSYTCRLHPPTVPAGAMILQPPGGVHAFALTDVQQTFDAANFLLDCGVSPPPPPPPPQAECGKLTGGGWISGTPSGAKGTFGVSGGIRRGEFWGHLNYVDHGNGMHVRSTAVTGFWVDPEDADCRFISYDVLIDDQPGTAMVRACDKGEPGRNDIFEIVLSNGYFAGGDLGGSRPGGGNIQLHKCPPGWE